VSMSLFFRSLAAYFALVLVAYAFLPDAGPDFLLKASALAAGASLLTPIAVPCIRGVRKGDSVEVESPALNAVPQVMRMLMPSSAGMAAEGGRKGAKIGVVFPDGNVRRCVITGYEGFFKPARCRLIEREVIDASNVTIA